MHPRDQLIENFRRHAPEISGDEVQKIKDYGVIFEYLSRPNHCGGIIMIENSPESPQLSDGTIITWQDVKPEVVVKNIESTISMQITEDRQGSVWIGVFEGLEQHRRPAKWEKPKSKQPVCMTAAEWREYFKNNPQGQDGGA